MSIMYHNKAFVKPLCHNYDILLCMADFSSRLRSEIDYIGLNQKEFAAKAGIKKRALDAYLGVQKSMPPADVAVKMATVLGLSVEYLVIGREIQHPRDITKYIHFKEILDDLSILPVQILNPIKAMIKAAADHERKNRKSRL